jgi:hypothetical protein
MSHHEDLGRDRRRARKAASFRSGFLWLRGQPSPPRHDDAPLSPRGKIEYYLLLAVLLVGGVIGIVWQATRH